MLSEQKSDHFEKNDTLNINDMADAILREICVPENIIGFKYLCTAISMTVADSDIINWGTKTLYDAISQLESTTPTRVESAIRRAIAITWERGNAEVLHKYFGYTIQNSRGKPTNSEFIAMIADNLRLKYKMYN